MIKTFYFKDKTYCNSYIVREVIIKVNSINLVMTLCNDFKWQMFLYKNEKYVHKYDVTDKIVNKLIKEAKEYQQFLYES